MSGRLGLISASKSVDLVLLIAQLNSSRIITNPPSRERYTKATREEEYGEGIT